MRSGPFQSRPKVAIDRGNSWFTGAKGRLLSTVSHTATI